MIGNTSAWLVLVLATVQASAYITNIDTNEIIQLSELQEKASLDLPLCRETSFCGYVEVNAYGVSNTQFCSCPRSGTPCSLLWDPEDGHSITQGSTQYKYCGPVPRMHMCGIDEIAYTANYILDADGPIEFHRLQCFCPPARMHTRASFTQELIDGKESMAVEHSCSAIPLCGKEQACKDVSVTPLANLVVVKCRCPRPYVCPTIPHHHETRPNIFNEGFVYSVHCQKMI